MQSNVVYVVAERSSGRIFNFKEEHFEGDSIGFDSFLPSEIMAQKFIERELGTLRRYAIIEVEIVSFNGTEVMVSFEPIHQYQTSEGEWF
jgi:hypothetical protein